MRPIVTTSSAPWWQRVLAAAAACIAFVTCAAPATAMELTALDAGSQAQLTALGNEALMQSRFETAIEHYRRAITADKDYFPALYNLALTYQQLNRMDEAERLYQAALRVRSDHPEVLCNLGIIAYRAGQYATAADRFLEAARLSGAQPADAADYWYNAGTARERLTRWTDAQRAYEEAIALDPRHVGAHFNLGTLALGALAGQANALVRAEEHLRAAAEIDPKRSETWLNLGLCRERLGRDADAATAFAEAIAVANGPARQRAYFERARWHQRAEPPRRPAMRDDLLAVLAGDPDYADANGMLGTYYFAIGAYDDAARRLEHEVAGDRFDATSPGDLEARYLLALIYTDHRPDAAKALAHAAAYYQHRPDSRKIHELRRRAMRLSGTSTADQAPAPGTTGGTAAGAGIASGKSTSSAPVQGAHTPPPTQPAPTQPTVTAPHPVAPAGSSHGH